MSLISRLNIHKTFGDTPVPGRVGGSVGGWTVWYGMVWYGMVWYGMVWYGNRIIFIAKVLKKHTKKPPVQRFSKKLHKNHRYKGSRKAQ